MYKSSNLAARIFERQIRTPAAGTSVHSARQFYENLVPSYTVYDVECPDHSFRKFTDDGQYLISFSRNNRDLIVYRPRWLTFSCKGEDCPQDLPPKAKRFESYFTQLYTVSLASSNEVLCKDFFLYMEGNQFGLFATSSTPLHDATVFGQGATPGVPSVDRITFILLRLEDGDVLDKKVLHNDFVNLAHNMGVFLYDDLLAIVSIRFQTIHILQIRDSGNIVDVRAIGTFCHEDDELFLNSNVQNMSAYDKSKLHQVSSNNSETGEHQNQPCQDNPFLSGLKQRLLSFVFRGLWNEETDETLTLKKKFYFHFQDYVDLIIWKVQFLDRQHLLIKFGSIEGGISRNTDNLPAFFAVYNMETTEIVAFYQNTAEDLYLFFEQFCDHFHVPSRDSLHMRFISTHSNNIHCLEQLKSIKSKSSSFSQCIRKMMGSLPFGCQSQSPSPYFDHSLFRYDEKLISAADRHRQATDHPIKFITRRQPYNLKFKIKSGPEGGSADSRAKRISSFLFHPFLPFAVSIQHTMFSHPSINIHFRR